MIIFARWTIRLLSFLILVSLLLSCRKFDSEISIPSYLQIDSLSVYTNYSEQGSSSEKITTIWLYVDDELIAINELPCLIPVLVEGVQKVRIDAGINMDGIKSFRIFYPFYEPIIQDVYFKPLEIVNLNEDSFTLNNSSVPYISHTTYKDVCEFTWMEDFEDPSYSLDSLPPSTVDILRTTPANNPEAFLSPNSQYSGVITLTEEKPYFRISTNVGNEQGIVLPYGGTNPIFLEFNFKCNHAFTVGVFANSLTHVEAKPVVVMNPSSEWNKIYINLKPVVDASYGAINFNIYFNGYMGSGIDPTLIYLDNLKLIHYK